MIIVKLRGGLGNQMFQYAFGKAQALKNNSKLSLDISHYFGKGPRSYSLINLNIKSEKVIEHRYLVKFKRIIGQYKTLKNTFFYDENLTNGRGNLYLDGYWESYKYFESVADTIKKEFVLKNPSYKFLGYSKTVRQNDIAVHVRRGDYLIPHGKYLNGKEYYEKAVLHLINKKNISSPTITIFSDDKSWCRELLPNLGGFPTKVFDDADISDVEEMVLMSCYENIAISNSTFSWWSAYLCVSTEKVVVVPKNWFTDSDLNAKYLADLMIPGWTVISS